MWVTPDRFLKFENSHKCLIFIRMREIGASNKVLITLDIRSYKKGGISLQALRFIYSVFIDIELNIWVLMIPHELSDIPP